MGSVELNMRRAPYCDPVETVIFEVIKMVNIKTMTISDMTLCISEGGNQSFGGILQVISLESLLISAFL